MDCNNPKCGLPITGATYILDDKEFCSQECFKTAFVPFPKTVQTATIHDEINAILGSDEAIKKFWSYGL